MRVVLPTPMFTPCRHTGMRPVRVVAKETENPCAGSVPSAAATSGRGWSARTVVVWIPLLPSWPPTTTRTSIAVVGLPVSTAHPATWTAPGPDEVALSRLPRGLPAWTSAMCRNVVGHWGVPRTMR